MDYLTVQSKLTREEWESIEVPLSAYDKQILELIQDGFKDVNISRNYTQTLKHHMKITITPQIETYIYIQYFQKLLNDLLNKYNISCINSKLSFDMSSITLKKADIIRLENTYSHIEDHSNKQNIFEFIVLDLLEKLLERKEASDAKVTTKSKSKKSQSENSDWVFYYYTLHNLLNYKVAGFNRILYESISDVLNQVVVVDKALMIKMMTMGQMLIEKNDYLLKHANETLYEHQKQLFSVCKQPNAKLILYIAPTGTGKTLSPIGLSQNYKVIFVCAARHVGLALAKAAISMQKKIAFAFGCNDAEDIRLHYYAAKEFTKNEKSGGIGKVDNTKGEKVEIIISDVQSYIPAMLYMLAFNPKEKIIMYWDEPTITFDYQDHALHPIIHKNWTDNLIPNVVLSSATLPHRSEINETITDFCARFDNVDVHEIVSYDCKKTIPLINREGFVEMPHYLFDNYKQTKQVVKHCLENKTLLRYIDLGEAIRFIMFIENKTGNNYISAQCSQRYKVENMFTDVETFNMYNIKMFYLNLLGNIKPETWPEIYQSMTNTRNKKQISNVNVVTTDAYTLTDGPTIFLADDVTKIAQFYIQNANIPESVITEIMEKIEYNRNINEKVEIMEKDFEDGTAEKNNDSAKTDKTKQKIKTKKADDRISPEMKQLKQKIDSLKLCIKQVMLNPSYVPNTKDHLYRYKKASTSTCDNGSGSGSEFTCNISEQVVEQIMSITDVENYWKLLLLMGIGVFATHKSVRYTELMKQLAQEHKLFMIIASSDYIYGTNYQLCHGYIGKDLCGMSQEKCIQAMGRVGRNKLQQDYSIRFRDNELIYKLFQHQDNKPEVINMNKLFSS